MYVIDVNASFGKRLDNDPRYSAASLAGELDRHEVALALAHSQRGVYYHAREGNDEAAAMAKAHGQIVPVAVLDPREWPRWRQDVARARTQGCRALRICPRTQGWSVQGAAFAQVLEELHGSGWRLICSASDGGNARDLAPHVAKATAPAGLPLILTDFSYSDVGEAIGLLQRYPHVYLEIDWMAGVGNIETLCSEVGAQRLLYGSAAPAHPMQKTINQVLEAAITDGDKAAILGGNAIRLLDLHGLLEGRPRLSYREPRGFSEEIIDVHSHLGHWFCCQPEEDYDPTGMLVRMAKLGIVYSVLSSYESMRYDLAEGNRRIAAAIAGYPQLRGYVEVDPNELELSLEEMARYYALPNYAGAELELNHINPPQGKSAHKLEDLMAAIARHGRPVLYMPPVPDGVQERQFARDLPGLKIIHAHGADANWARVVADTPNICVEFNRSRPSHHDIAEVLAILGPERILFGTDQTLLSPAASVGAYLDAQLTARQRQLVLSGNARRLFDFA